LGEGPEEPPWVGDGGNEVGDGGQTDGIVTDCAKGLLGNFNAWDAAAPGHNLPPVKGVLRKGEWGWEGEVFAVGCHQVLMLKGGRH